MNDASLTLEKWGRTSPFGLLRYAHEYHVAADIVHDSGEVGEFTMPQYSLMGQSIELSLKAFLRSRGFTTKMLSGRAYGHDLTYLLETAKSKHLAWVHELLDFQEEAIIVLNPAYSSHKFRYIENGSLDLPKWDLLSLTASLLTSSLHDHCVRATLGAPVAKRIIAHRGNLFSKKNPPPKNGNAK